MKNDAYQYDFSELYPDKLYNVFGREQKAKKMLSILQEHFPQGLEKLKLMDIGCSTGILANFLSQYVGEVVGADIDEKGIAYAKKTHQLDNLRFEVQDGMNLTYDANTFDIITCAHAYEHVPDADKLMAEIHRVLKPDGVCYFAAGNRLNLIEPHYKLPLLSVFPKPMAHWYLKILGKGDFYYEKLRTLPTLRKLVNSFEVIDYTKKIIDHPEQYEATDMVKSGTLKQKLAKILLTVAYGLSPTYIWLLKKNESIGSGTHNIISFVSRRGFRDVGF